MRKNFKRATVVAAAMALTMSSIMPAFAANTGEYKGTIESADLNMNITLPTNGALTIKPYSGTQITTAPLYFKNTEVAAAATGDDVVSYKIGIAGYTCVATSATAEDPIKAVTALTEDTKKNFTAKIELGTAVATTSEKTDAKEFKDNFGSTTDSCAIEKLSEASYDGTAATTYNKNLTSTPATVAPQESLPFRITGTMNTAANWEVGDSITIVPVYSVAISVTQKS